MKLSVTSWSFPHCTLKETVGIVKALGLGAVDVGFLYRSALDKGALLDDPEGAAEALNVHDIALSNLYYLFGASPEDRNLALSESLKGNVKDFEKVMIFCKAAAISSVMILPGVLNQGQRRQDALEQTATALKELIPVAKNVGVVVTAEPHVHSYLESPSLVLDLLEKVPDLKLALDYAHLVCLGYRQEEIDVLAPAAGHVHLRQARPGVLQAKLEEGTLNFPALLATLRKTGYDGYLATEYVHQAYMGTLYDDVLSETIKMRDLVQKYSGSHL